MFSPDGRLVLYNQSGELWVRSEPAGSSTPRLIGQEQAFRFLARRAHPSPPPTLAIVENFFEELRAKLPVK